MKYCSLNLTNVVSVLQFVFFYTMTLMQNLDKRYGVFKKRMSESHVSKNIFGFRICQIFVLYLPYMGKMATFGSPSIYG